MKLAPLQNPIPFKELQTHINELESLVGNLPSSDTKFALSLISQFKLKGDLSLNQQPYVLELIKQAKQEKPQTLSTPEPVAIGGFAAMQALFAEAKKHLKNPKIKLQWNDQLIELSMPKSTVNKLYGHIAIRTVEKFKSAWGLKQKWYGSISPEGVWTPSTYLNPVERESLYELLLDFAEAPAAVAAKYGKMTGQCCFCAKPLSDPNSVTVGYGPICAEHYDLPWGEIDVKGLSSHFEQLENLTPAQFNSLKDSLTNAINSKYPDTTEDVKALSEKFAASSKAIVDNAGIYTMGVDYATADATVNLNYKGLTPPEVEGVLTGSVIEDLSEKVSKAMAKNLDQLVTYDSVPGLASMNIAYWNTKTKTPTLQTCFICEEHPTDILIDGYPVCELCRAVMNPQSPAQDLAQSA